MIPHLSPITVKPLRLNERLWTLVSKEQSGALTPDEKIELDCLCKTLEQDNGENYER